MDIEKTSKRQNGVVSNVFRMSSACCVYNKFKDLFIPHIVQSFHPFTVELRKCKADLAMLTSPNTQCCQQPQHPYHNKLSSQPAILQKKQCGEECILNY